MTEEEFNKLSHDEQESWVFDYSELIHVKTNKKVHYGLYAHNTFLLR